MDEGQCFLGWWGGGDIFFLKRFFDLAGNSLLVDNEIRFYNSLTRYGGGDSLTPPPSNQVPSICIKSFSRTEF